MTTKSLIKAALCRRVGLLSCVVIVMLGTIAVATASLFSSSKATPEPAAATSSNAPPAPTATKGRSVANIEAELVTVTPHGFEPREITQPMGSFLLMIDNRSGLRQVSLHLSREAGARLRDVPVPREEPNWSEVIALPPGRYVLTEADHPAWSCRIVISAQ